MTMKTFSVSADFTFFKEEEVELGRGPTNDNEEFSISADFKC